MRGMMSWAISTGIVAASVVAIAAVAYVMLGRGLPRNMPIRLSSEDRYAEVLGARLRYRLTDKGGEPVIFLHSFGGSLHEWDRIIPAMEMGRLYALDLIGFGASEAPNIDYSLVTLAKYVVAFLDGEGIARATIVGSSMGASIALWIAASYPERVRALGVFAPSAYPGSMRHPFPAGLLYRPGILNRLAAVAAGLHVTDTLFPGNLGRQALGTTASYTQDFAKALPRVACPVLILWSRSDRRVPFGTAERYLVLLPQARLVEGPLAAGHGVGGYESATIAALLGQLLAYPSTSGAPSSMTKPRQ
jgi:pimeloyl-ACP methyl ester carboxylesterase